MIQHRSLASLLALQGESPAMCRVRTQIKVVAPHLRTALIVSSDSQIAETVARELHSSAGERSGPLLIMAPEGLNEIARENRDAFLKRMETTQVGHLYVPTINTLTTEAQEMLLSFLVQKDRTGGRRCLLGSRSASARAHFTEEEGGELQRRLASVTIRIPSLAERPEDLRALTEMALRELSERSGVEASPLEATALSLLQEHPWPGDIGELESVLSSAMEISAGRPLTRTLLERLLRPQNDPLSVSIQDEVFRSPAADATSLRLQDVIDRHVLEVLNRCDGNKVRAAETLGISRSTLYRMLESLEAGRPLN